MVDDPMIGRTVGDYRIDASVGRGGMGVVYRAEQLALGRTVALKLISPESWTTRRSATVVHESRLAAAIEHPHVIPVYEAGERDGLLFISMRFIDGMDLRAAIGPFARLAPASPASSSPGLARSSPQPADW